MRLVFAGTPQTAVPSLEALLASSHTVAAVLTRPDAPAGRGRRVAASPVAQRARDAGLEVLQPARPSDPAFQQRLAEIGPDCCPVTAYGALIPEPALRIPAHGWVNLHFSVLPAWRGAAPVQHAILHGDEITGATTFELVRELDAGPVYGVLTEVIKPADTAGDLLGRLAVAGAGLLVATLDGIESGELEARPQPPDGVSLAPKIDRDDARVTWSQPAMAIGRLHPGVHARARGLDHPGRSDAQARSGDHARQPGRRPARAVRGGVADPRSGRLRRHRHPAGPARLGPAARQAGDAGRGLGQGLAGRRAGAELR